MKRGIFWLGIVLAVVLAAVVVVVGLNISSTSDNGLLDAADVKATLEAIPTVEPPDASTTIERPSPILEPFYGMVFVHEDQFEAVRELGIEVVHLKFEHRDSPADWVSLLNKAQAHGLKVITWLWPEGWQWDGSAWEIDDTARSFVETVAQHPATLAVYGLHEPYWQGCWGCGYTTAQQQQLYDAIKAIADVPIYAEVGGVAFWTDEGEETAFDERVCDYCGNWYYPFFDGEYDRDFYLEKLKADVAVTRERAPNSKIIWGLQAFAQDSSGHTMPDAEQMYDLAALAFAAGVDGASWYPWRFSEQYSDYLSKHPELFDTVRQIYDTIVLPYREREE